MDYKELLDRLTTDREWAQANEWESPICLQDDLSAAITMIYTLTAKAEELQAENAQLRKMQPVAVDGDTAAMALELARARAELSNYEQVTDWLRRNGFESFEALTEAFEQVKRERDAYMFCSKDLLSKGNCNECGDRENCNYLPRPGETVRVNCPLWRGPQKEE